MKKFLAPAIASTAALLLFGCGETASTEAAAGTVEAATAKEERRPAPEFALKDADGKEHKLSDFKGKVVLLNFWATWCPPCVQELPSLNSIHERFRDRGLVVVGISVDEDKEAYQKFLQQRGVTFPTARDPEQTVNSRYGTTKFPESYLIDREGYVRREYVGPEDWERPEIVNYLSSLL